MYDCGFAKGNHWFRYRAGGIVIKDNKILFVRSKIGDYFYMIGGGVHMGETSEECIEREFLEETGIKVQVERLAVVCENFFKGDGGSNDGLDCHTLEFYYILKIEDDSASVKETDEGEALVWLPVDEIRDSDIKPSFIKSHIENIMNGKNVIHMIWKDK